MRTLKHTIYYPSVTDQFRLWHLTDLHVGAKACDEALLASHIKQIANDPNAYWIGGGDYVEAIAHHDKKRWKPETVAKWALGHTDVIGRQRDYVLDMLSPIADKCVGLVAGNHEFECDKHYARNIYWEIVTSLAQKKGVAPETLGLGVQGYVVTVFRRGKGKKDNGGNPAWKMVTFIHHGFGGGALAGSHALTLQRMMLRHPCDLLLMGHRHTSVLLPVHRVLPSDANANTYTAWGMFSQSYLRSYIEPMENGMPVDTYAEQKGLGSNDVGAFPVEITPDQKRIVIQAGGGR